jgi:Dolichyl-phosphate-mannose-protein mannosyltransferase
MPAFATPDRVFRFLLSAFAITTLSLSVLLPAWEANDEPDHVRNVETLVSGRWYRIEKDAGYQPHQAPLYYLALAGWQKVAGFDPWTPTFAPNPAAPAGGQFTHDDAESQRRVVFLRLPSIALGLLTIWLTRRIARHVRLSEWGALAAAAIVATVPRFVFLSSVVTNDTLAITLGTLSILFAVRCWMADSQRAPLRDLLVLGVVSGLLLDTKLTPVPFVAVLVGLPILRTIRNEVQAGVARSKIAWSKIAWSNIARSSLPAFTMLVVAAPVLISNHIRYGDPLASTASLEYFRSWIPALVIPNTAFSWLGITVTSGFLTSFWYTSGWNQFRWRAISYVPFWALSAIGFAGLVRGFRARRTPASQRDPSVAPAIPTLLLSSAALASASAVWILAANATQWQARLSFPALSAFAVLIVLGYQRLRLPTVLWFLLPALGAAGTLYAIHTDVVGRYY